jgi:hypothetical protein
MSNQLYACAYKLIDETYRIHTQRVEGRDKIVASPHRHSIESFGRGLLVAMKSALEFKVMDITPLLETGAITERSIFQIG